jgi:hypothetical protein
VPRRVVVWGPGNVGAPALRTVVSHPGLELSGVVVHAPEKEGRDAGELVGLPPLGIRATRDAEAALAGADALFYGANQDFRPREAADEMIAALARGVSVVTAGTYGLLHPATADPALRERFEQACRAGGSAFLASGIDPGFALDLLPLALSGVCEELREIRIVENFNYATYAVPAEVQKILGFGAALDSPPPMLMPGVPSLVWGGAVRALAEALGVPLEEVREVRELHPLERDARLPTGTLSAGTLGAFRFEVQGISGGRPVVVLEHVTRIVDDTAPQWPRPAGMGHHQVRIEGRPRMTLTLECEDEHGDHVAGGNAAAAARLVHAIPYLCEAEPRIHAGIELPLIIGRGLVRTS